MTRKLLVAAAALALGLLITESAYRIVLDAAARRQSEKPTFAVDSGSFYEFDEDLGYRYKAGTSVLRCTFRDGRPVDCKPVVIDSLGNLSSAWAFPSGRQPDNVHGNPTPGERQRMLAFGDSFTANPNQPVSWTDFLAEETGDEVLNFGRDGYGVQQIFRLAALKSEEFRPDVVIVALIVEDLTRGFSWRSTVQRNGEARILVAPDPNPDPDLRVAMDLVLVEPRITRSWFESVASDGGVEDPLFESLTGRYSTYAAEDRVLNLKDLDRFFIIERLLHGDPYHGLYKPVRNPPSNLKSLDEDSTLVRDIGRIEAPLLILIVPTYDDLRAKKRMITSLHVDLMQSLTRISGVSLIDLSRFMDLGDRKLDDLFRLPYDPHPSVAGAELYGKAVAQALLRLDKVNRERAARKK